MLKEVQETRHDVQSGLESLWNLVVILSHAAFLLLGRGVRAWPAKRKGARHRWLAGLISLFCLGAARFDER